ncbi:unnamed protein product [Strongylus vulgaris]|uniref:Uncharacterized protein n=1 Tax=Strongylus vulgaris TaxID=40348 RepID=A0A3P7ICU5_STRVU|nr:unnamed protein product [Strongylus vulgaris]
MEDDEEKSAEHPQPQRQSSDAEKFGDAMATEPNSIGTDPKKRRISEAVDVPSSSATSNNTQLPSWVAGGSPAHFVSSDELLKMSLAMDNLALVHEIAIDPNFSVSEIPANPIEAAVKWREYVPRILGHPF